MKTRLPLFSALILVLGASIFLTGMWVGGRRMPTQASAITDLESAKRIEQPKKPEFPSETPPATSKAVAKVPKPSSTKPTVSKVTISDTEYARGKVIDPSGKALAGAEITVGGAWPTHAVTDSQGKFRVEVPQLEWKPGG